MTTRDGYTPLNIDADTLRAMARMELDGSDTPDDLRGLRGRGLLGAAIKLEQREATEREILQAAVDRMGWPEIHAFKEEMSRGQSIDEDAGGFWMRGLSRLFGLRAVRGEVTTYKDAARAMIDRTDGKDRTSP